MLQLNYQYKTITTFKFTFNFLVALLLLLDSLDELFFAQRDNNLMITPQMIMRMEFKILHELRWKIRPVTPFTYLNFYYRYFKQFGGYKRRCINEIIVQAQGGK
jgi:hypothetical protein